MSKIEQDGRHDAVVVHDDREVIVVGDHVDGVAGLTHPLCPPITREKKDSDRAAVVDGRDRQQRDDDQYDGRRNRPPPRWRFSHTSSKSGHAAPPKKTAATTTKGNW